MVKLSFFHFRVTNSKLKNIKLHIELLIQFWLILYNQFYLCHLPLEDHQEKASLFFWWRTKKFFFNCRTESFKNSFFQYIIETWYRLYPAIINSSSLVVFKSKLLAFIRPVQRSIYSVFNSQGLKFLIRLRLGLSHLNRHKFRHIFKDFINPLCSCSLEVENTLHFFLHCLHCSTLRMSLMNKVNQIDENFHTYLMIIK